MATKERDPALLQAIEEAGGPVALAKFISETYDPITPQAICDWKRCPRGRVLQVEHAVRAAGGRSTKHDLCPDIFPREQAA